MARRAAPRGARDRGQDRRRRRRHHDRRDRRDAISTTSRSATGTPRPRARPAGRRYAYSGAPEPIALDQDGAGNVLLVSLDAPDGKKQVTVEERKVGRTRFERVQLDAATVGSQPEPRREAGRAGGPGPRPRRRAHRRQAGRARRPRRRGRDASSPIGSSRSASATGRSRRCPRARSPRPTRCSARSSATSRRADRRGRGARDDDARPPNELRDCAPARPAAAVAGTEVTL